MSKKKIDYLTHDPEIYDQRWVCISFLTPETIEMENCNMRSVKIRGVYGTEEQAKQQCEKLRAIDPIFNIYVAPVGKWLPWCDDPSKADSAEYQEKELNKLMKSYQENQAKAKCHHEERKNEMIQKSVEESESRKKKNKKKNKPSTIDTDNLNKEYNNNKDKDVYNNIKHLIDNKDVFKNEENKYNQEENVLNTEKNILLDEKKSYENQENIVSSLNDELNNAKKLYENMIVKSI